MLGNNAAPPPFKPQKIKYPLWKKPGLFCVRPERGFVRLLLHKRRPNYGGKNEQKKISKKS